MASVAVCIFDIDGADGSVVGTVIYWKDDDVPPLLYAATFVEVPFKDLAVTL